MIIKNTILTFTNRRITFMNINDFYTSTKEHKKGFFHKKTSKYANQFNQRKQNKQTKSTNQPNNSSYRIHLNVFRSNYGSANYRVTASANLICSELQKIRIREVRFMEV